MKIALFNKPFIVKVCFSIFIFGFLFTQSSQVSAGFFSDLITKVLGREIQAAEITPPSNDLVYNSQNLPLLESSVNPDVKDINNETPIVYKTDDTLLSNDGALGVDSDLEKYVSTSKIITYTVQKGDTLGGISNKLNVPISTILLSNTDISKNDLLKIGQTLTILAIGTKSDNVSKPEKVVTKKKEIKEKKIIPSPEEVAVNEPPIITQPQPETVPNPIINTEPTSPVANNNQADTSKTNEQQPKEQLPVSPNSQSGQPSGEIKEGYIWPFPAGIGRVSQGLHADDAYDFAAPKNTPIFAVHDGTVLIVHPTGYNGGYGRYVVIDFTDGRQAIFGHMNKVATKVGEVVKQGDIIGYVGSTGMSTGPHVHIGFHGDLGNPYTNLKVNSTEILNSND